MAEDLDEAEGYREAPEEPEARALGFARGVGLVPEIGVLGVRRYLVVGDGGPGEAEGLPANLLAELVEAMMSCFASNSSCLSSS